MVSKLDLEKALIEKSIFHAKNIADKVKKFCVSRTTYTVERTIARLLGIDGVNAIGAPLPNVLVEDIAENGDISRGVLYYICNAMIQKGLQPQQIAEQVAAKELALAKLKMAASIRIEALAQEKCGEALRQILAVRKKREEKISRLGSNPKPWLYVLVATGNVYEDVRQSQSIAKHGADIIAVLRSTAQSLLDYVPYGPTIEGYGGTYATQCNFRIMRKALDDVGVEVGRYIRLSNFCSGLCMPEIAALGAVEGLDNMANDALYGILYRDINPKRTFIDQHFSRMINGYSGVVINTGEDNYLRTSDAVEKAHTVLASQMINYYLAKNAGLPDSQIGLGHAFEMNPDLENGFLWELAQAQMVREIFPNVPIKWMPPTRHMTGDIFRTHVCDAMFNLISVWTRQEIETLGVPTEGIHTPFIQDRLLGLQNAKYVFNNCRNIGDEIFFKPGGIIQTRAQQVLQKASVLISWIDEVGLFEALKQKTFGDVSRDENGGKGLDGVVVKHEQYLNFFEELMMGGYDGS